MSWTSPSANEPDERRNYHRVPVSIAGKYMLEDKRDFPCRTIDMSAGGVSLAAPVRGAIGERVVVYLQYIGRVEGIIVRETPLGFALELSLAGNKRDHIADRLMWVLNRDALKEEDRRHERIVPIMRRCILTENGHEHIVRLLDVSISGAACTIGPLKIPKDTKVLLGSTAGHVVRHFENGLAIEFDAPIPIERFDENIRL